MRIVNRRKAAAAALLGLVACATAACGSSSPQAAGHPAPAAGGTQPGAVQPSSQSTAPVPATHTACVNAPSSLVGKTLGLATGKLTANIEDPVTVCAYAGKYEVLVRYQSEISAAEFAQARSSQAALHQPVSTVSGLGDGAYFASYTASKPASNTLAAMKGDRAVFITSPAALSAERSLMTVLLSKM